MVATSPDQTRFLTHEAAMRLMSAPPALKDRNAFLPVYSECL